jgi:hypothetical protein
VSPDPTPGKRIEFKRLRALVDGHGARQRCPIDSARRPPEPPIDCFAPAARDARAATAAVAAGGSR